MPIPTPDTIPTHWGYFQFLLLLTFPLHLLFMNALLGASTVALFSHLRQDEPSRQLAYELARVIPLLVAFTVNFGVAPLLFLQVLYGHLFYSSSVLMGLFWILIIPLLLSGYYATYWYDFKFTALGRAGFGILALALLLFLIIGFFLSNNMSLMLQPALWDAYLTNDSGTLLNLRDPAQWPRYLHFMTGAIAVGGLAVALYGRFLARRDAVLGQRAAELGRGLFLALSLAQIVVGLWFLFALPAPVRSQFLGGNIPATLLFSVALLVTVLVLYTAWRRRLFLTAGLTLLLIYLMSFMRDLVRSGYLRDIFTVRDLEIVPQYSPLLLFLATLVVGVLLMAWMLHAAWTRCES